MPQIAVLHPTVGSALEGETRVALTPAGVKKLISATNAIAVERGAGAAAGFSDSEYEKAGASLVDAGGANEADITLCVSAPSIERIGTLKPGSLLIGLISPYDNREVLAAANTRQISLLAMEFVPRITRAQAMDALSSQANIAGYKAVLFAATHSTRVFPMMMTAAGTIQPARVLVIGAGVAGLQAIATAKRLGAIVTAYDVRPAVKEQVQSVGARFLELPLDTSQSQDAGGYAKAQSEETLARQRDLLAKAVAESDVVITTALVPGKPAPKLIPASVVGSMKSGAVIVDLAAERGGNCEATRPGEVATVDGVTIVGLKNLAATSPFHASSVYSNNLVSLFSVLVDKEGKLKLDEPDEIVSAMLVTHRGQIVHAGMKEAS